MPNGIADQTLANLRTAAALLLVCPGLAVTVGVDGTTVVEARRPPVPASTHPIIAVCAFHRCVAKAHGMRRSGQQVQMVGVDGDVEPLIALHADTDDVRMVPGGIVRWTHEGRWIHLLAVSVADAVADAALERARAEADGDLHADVEVHADRALGVTVLVVDGPVGDKRSARNAIDAIELVAAMASIDALVDGLEPGDVDAEFASLVGVGRVGPAVTPADVPWAGSVRADRSNP